MGKVLLRVAGIAGLATPIFVFVCIFVAITSWSNFNWPGNALSDLGVQWGFTATLFNTALVIGGLSFMVVSAGLWEFLGSRWVGKLGVGLFLVACVALVCIGIFNETFSPTHYIVSVMFFVSMPISFLVFVAGLWLEGHHRMSVVTLMLGVIAAAVWILQFAVQYVPNLAIPETISGLAGCAWAMAMGYLMLKKGQEQLSSGQFQQKSD